MKKNIDNRVKGGLSKSDCCEKTSESSNKEVVDGLHQSTLRAIVRV